MREIDFELEPMKIWLAYGYDARQLDAFDTGFDFRGLADAVYLPAHDFAIFVADQQMSPDWTITKLGGDVVEMHDSNSDATYRFEPQIYKGQIVYFVETFGFSRVEIADIARAISTAAENVRESYPDMDDAEAVAHIRRTITADEIYDRDDIAIAYQAVILASDAQITEALAA